MGFLYITFSALSAWLILFLALVDAGSIASWTTGRDVPQVMVQDDDTGKIFYSLCNSNGTVVFPTNESRSLTFDRGLEPRKDSSIAGIGFVDDQGIITSGIWYLNDANNIVHALWKCNETGHFVNASNPNQWVLTPDGESVSAKTGLAALNLGRDAGYRVFYKQEDFTTSAFMYTTDSGWSWDGNISQDQLAGFPIAAGFSDPDRISVVFPRDEANIELSYLYNGTWSIITFPGDVHVAGHNSSEDFQSPTNATDPLDFDVEDSPGAKPLDAWDGQVKAIGYTRDSDNVSRIFYIGLDSNLHCVSAIGGWLPCTDINANKWPTADSPNAPFATAFDASRDEIWIYYMSGGNLTQVYRSSKNKWEDPIALPATQPPPSGEYVRGRLSKGSKAGIGTGAGIFTLSLIGLAAYIYLQRKRGKERDQKLKADADAEAAAAANKTTTLYPSPAPTYTSGVPGLYWAEGKWASIPDPNVWAGPWQYQPVPGSFPLTEMTNRHQIHEMAHDFRYLEMAEGSSGRINNV
ncbi:hypothetical protein F4861DRAFT_548532 [Xylaria intraflava]|nr:hypothetical protein F4861DRAFT_548532 [Xylaria intraflava]